MTTQRDVSRWSLARRLQNVALRISADKPIRIDGVWVRVPDRVVLEEEVETDDGKVDIEFEIKWPATADQSSKKTSRPSSRRRKSRRSS